MVLQKMAQKLHHLRNTLAQELKKLRKSDFTKVHSTIMSELTNLTREGVLIFNNDFSLKSEALEYRVEQLFWMMNFEVIRGRPNLEDLIVKADDKSDPLVVEIKSAKNSSSPSTTDLRQLDDYVFELSGEEVARKEGLGRSKLHSDTFNGWGGRQRHPTPHKGVMVFNGPTNKPFDQRPSDWLGSNEKEFAERRNFCIISLPCLRSWTDACQDDSKIAKTFLDRGQNTSVV